MTEPEQWAVELLDAVFDASDLGSACGIVDCPQCANAALTIQRAFEEQTRELREALTAARKIIADIDDYMKRPGRGDWGEECACCMGELLDDDRQAIAKIDQALATRQPTPTEGSSHDQ